MAEELAPTPGEAEASTTPAVEEVTPVIQEDEQQETIPSVEELAVQAGWKPKEEWKGDAETWRPAHEYLLASKDRVSSIGKELKAQRDQLARMTQAQEFVVQTTLRDRDAFWQAKMDEAFEAGDKPGYDEAGKQRDILRQAMPINAPPSEVQEFTQRHSNWFNKDFSATQLALAVCEQNKNLSPDQQLNLAESEVKKRFPEYFQAANGKAPPQVNRPDSRTSPRGNGRKAFHDMPKEAQDAALKFERDHGVPKESYTENYFKRIERTA